jgi:DNA-binding response OmpR family regulator
MRVLIAEDDDSIRGLLEIFLRHKGFEAVAVENGRKALEVVDSDKPPQIILLDWMMPGVSGLSVLQRVRAREVEGQHAYVIMLTALNDDVHIEEAIGAGVDDFITKPYNPLLLETRLNAAKRFVTLLESKRGT